MSYEVLSLPNFRFESGVEVGDAPVAWQSWGELNEARDNVIFVCHALTGDTAVDQWWRPLLGSGRAFDTDRYCVICANVIGSPYGSLSSLTTNPETGRRWGSDLPVPTVRDTVELHRQLLAHLGVRQVAFAIGGSMGGMQALEWAFYGDFVRAIVPIAVGGRHSAWCIGWSEAQREAIFSDPAWQAGEYGESPGPQKGLAVARMIAMISYRSFESFGERFGRERAESGKGSGGWGDGFRRPNDQPGAADQLTDRYSMENYLRYQGRKLVDRFDAKCYVQLTRSMDTHDIARGRGEYDEVLANIRQPALIVGIDSDLLYPLAEQRELVERMPNAEFAVLEAAHGHDSFLIELESLDRIVREWRERVVD